MNPVMPSSPLPGSVVAYTTRTSATGPLATKLLEPSSTQPSPSRRAVLTIENTSDPAADSVAPCPATREPSSRPGSHRRFCSGVPNRTIGITPAQRWALIENSSPRSSTNRPSVSMTTIVDRRPTPRPPSSSGTGRRRIPASAQASHPSRQKIPSRSRSTPDPARRSRAMASTSPRSSMMSSESSIDPFQKESSTPPFSAEGTSL